VGGILINSQPHRDNLSGYFTIESEMNMNSNNESTGDNFIYSLIIVVLFYTPSNLILLCMTAGLLGAISRIAKLHVKDFNEPELPSDKTDPLMSGILRGLFVYLLAISGILLINDNPITLPTQAQYVRLAGILSILSFLLSYNPSRFQSFIAKGMDAVQEKMHLKSNTTK
jgi:hypothetical protein